ncbi:hypothetical protein F5Y15DRAFT_303954 [Xylariaceae sp. FL0016]|nr:hypothetical protein F5Y15DRAFT_303954 [Xylariaceae sp. FL0016]
MSLDHFHQLPPAEQQRVLNGPSLEPPEGVVPNFDHPPNNNVLALGISSYCLAVSTMSVLLRVYARFWCMRKGLVEDYLAIAAFIIYLGFVYVVYWHVHVLGFFVHQWDIRVKDISAELYMVYIGANLYATVMLIMKACILQEWARLFVPRATRNTFFWVCHTVQIVTVVFYAVIVVMGNLSCFPQRRIWDRTTPGTDCLDLTVEFIASSAINVALDIVTLALPQKAIWGLQMSTKRKVGISCIFIVGILACVSAAARLVYAVKYHLASDRTYTEAPFAMWSHAEMMCMFLVFAGPAIPKAFRSASSSASAGGRGGLKGTLGRISRSWSKWSGTLGTIPRRASAVLSPPRTRSMSAARHAAFDSLEQLPLDVLTNIDVEAGLVRAKLADRREEEVVGQGGQGSAVYGVPDGNQECMSDAGFGFRQQHSWEKN